MADRAISITLPAIPEDQRRTEAEHWSDFEVAKPALLGALLDAIAAAIKHLPDTELTKIPRMADFAKLIMAAEPGLGWEPDTFLNDYDLNLNQGVAAALEANPVAGAIQSFIGDDMPDGWEGTAGELQGHLDGKVSEVVRKSRSWPHSPSAVGTAVRRVAPVLRPLGIEIEFHKGGADSRRLINIKPKGAAQ